MTRNQRLQHMVLLVCFGVLVVSGFALLSPFSGWADAIGFIDPVRRIVHRIAGVILIGASVYHLVYLFKTRNGRRWLRDMLPRVRDVHEAVETVGYNLGYRKSPPRYARFNYIEKAEYWALVWGVAVMALTGILLWSHNFILAHLPYPMSVMDVSTAIHFYEAILATFAILIWHFYAVIFDPDVYPVKWTFLTGRAPEHEVREEEEEEVPAEPPAKGEGGPPAKSPPATPETKPASDASDQPEPPPEGKPPEPKGDDGKGRPN